MGKASGPGRAHAPGSPTGPMQQRDRTGRKQAGVAGLGLSGSPAAPTPAYHPHPQVSAHFHQQQTCLLLAAGALVTN